MDSNPAILDPNAIETLRSINPDDGGEFLRELVDVFLADTPKRIAEIEQAVAHGEAGNVARAAHSIKGSSSTFGAVQFAALLRAIEAQGLAGDIAAVRAGLPAVHAEFARLQPALEQLKHGS